jgi:hypothetical protein
MGLVGAPTHAGTGGMNTRKGSGVGPLEALANIGTSGLGTQKSLGVGPFEAPMHARPGGLDAWTIEKERG